MKRVTSRNTKAEILDAYDELLAEYKLLQKEAKAQGKAMPTPATTKAPKAEPVKLTTKSFDVEGFLGSLQSLRAGFGQCANGLQRQLTQEAVQLHDILSKANEHSTNIHTLHDIEINDSTLSTLISNYMTQESTFNEALELKKSTFEKEMARQFDLWSQTKAARALLVKERQQDLKTTRTREENEYIYERDFHRKQDEDAYTRLKEKREAELEQFQDDAQEKWDKREMELLEREEEFDTLTDEVAGFEERLKSAKEQGKAEGTNIAKRQSKIDIDMLSKEHEGKRRVYELQIASLEDTIAKQAEQLAKLTAQLTTAKTQAQELAVKALEGAAQTNSLQAIREIAMEHAKHGTKGK